MYSIDHNDLGTRRPPRRNARDPRIDGRQLTVPAGTSVMRAAALAGARPEAVRHRHARRPSAPAGCAWSRSRAEGLPGLVHDAGRAGHEGADRERRSSPSCARASSSCTSPIIRWTARLPGRRPLRAAGHGGARRRAVPAQRSPLRL